MYDALNVLIAADVLKKDGKRVYSEMDGKRTVYKEHPHKVKTALLE